MVSLPAFPFILSRTIACDGVIVFTALQSEEATPPFII